MLKNKSHSGLLTCRPDFANGLGVSLLSLTGLHYTEAEALIENAFIDLP